MKGYVMAKKEIQTIKRHKNSKSRDPKKECETLVDRFLSDPFGSWQGLSTQDQRSLGEVEETEDGYILSAELPGTSMEEVNISVHGKHISISADHKEHYGKDDGDHNFRDSCRSFHQTFTLPETVDAKKIRASCNNGLLHVFMPKKAPSHKVALSSLKIDPPAHHHHKGH